MKHRPSFSFASLARMLLAVAGVLGFVASSIAQTAATGTIEGRVFDSGRGEFLEKARLTVEGTGLATFTEAGGQYRFTNVPAGTVKLTTLLPTATAAGRCMPLVSCAWP